MSDVDDSVFVGDGVPHRLEVLVGSMPLAAALGLKFVSVAPGQVRVAAPITEAWTFRERTVQATALFAMGDFAAVGAALTLLPDGWVNATVDGQVKIVAPGRGDSLVAEGRVVVDGPRTTICRADVWVVDDGIETLCATWFGSAHNIRPVGESAGR